MWQEYARSEGMLYVETSAKTGEGILPMFETVAQRLGRLRKRQKQTLNSAEKAGGNGAVQLQKVEVAKSSGSGFCEAGCGR